jgi:hypothetical protein
MRTTLDIDADVLGAAKQLAKERRTSAGKVLSELAREALGPKKKPKYRNGFQLLERRPGMPAMTMDLVNRMLNEE